VLAARTSPAFDGKEAQQLRAAAVRLADPLDVVHELLRACVVGQRLLDLAEQRDRLTVGAHVGLLEDLVEQAAVDADRLVGMSLASCVRRLPPEANLAAPVDCIGPGSLDLAFLELGAHERAREDFSAYLRAAPACFFLVGAGSENAFPHHHPRFTIDDEAALPVRSTR
jgi:hypothetical protein